MAKTVFCQWCAGEPGDHHPECPFGRAERAEQRIAELEEAGRRLYYAGFWRCDREVDEVALWDRMKAVLGLPHGTSPARTVEGGEDA